MRFEIAGSTPRSTPVSLRLDPDGDVAVLANNMTLLWIRANGRILLAANGDELKKLGFQVDDDTDSVLIED